MTALAGGVSAAEWVDGGTLLVAAAVYPDCGGRCLQRKPPPANPYALEQGLSIFTALKRRGVPSKLVVFPDENHWVLKPWNSVKWHQEVLGWLDQWARK